MNVIFLPAAQEELAATAVYLDEFSVLLRRQPDISPLVHLHHLRRECTLDGVASSP
jgi:hypothetical protein